MRLNQFRLPLLSILSSILVAHSYAQPTIEPSQPLSEGNSAISNDELDAIAKQIKALLNDRDNHTTAPLNNIVTLFIDASGKITHVETLHSSGDLTYDAFVTQIFLDSSPLPPPNLQLEENTELVMHFRVTQQPDGVSIKLLYDDLSLLENK